MKARLSAGTFQPSFPYSSLCAYETAYHRSPLLSSGCFLGLVKCLHLVDIVMITEVHLGMKLRKALRYLQRFVPKKR